MIKTIPVFIRVELSLIIVVIYQTLNLKVFDYTKIWLLVGFILNLKIYFLQTSTLVCSINRFQNLRTLIQQKLMMKFRI